MLTKETKEMLITNLAAVLADEHSEGLIEAIGILSREEVKEAEEGEEWPTIHIGIDPGTDRDEVMAYILQSVTKHANRPTPGSGFAHTFAPKVKVPRHPLEPAEEPTVKGTPFEAAEPDQLSQLADEIHATAVEKGWWDRDKALVTLLEDIEGYFKARGTDISFIPPSLILESITKMIIDAWPKRNIGELYMLMVTEIAEAFEEYRNGKGDDIYFVKGKPEGQPIEIADLVIRLLDTAKARGWDIGSAVRMKMEYNKGRAHRHGGKLA